MDEFFRAIAAESKLPENIARQLTDAGYVVIEGPVAHNKCEQLATAYDAAVLAAHPDDVRISSSTRISNFVNRGPEFDELYIYGPLLAACPGRLHPAGVSIERQLKGPHAPRDSWAHWRSREIFVGR